MTIMTPIADRGHFISYRDSFILQHNCNKHAETRFGSAVAPHIITG